ncbi:hypothetical protein DXG01_013043 [Tephrocybe rancida]|nr:hypothetical protein DXG01_013043 [Tephrocybe rancida]
MHGLSPHQVQNIPAVIFVWSQGESYKHHIERIAQDLSGSEPEVCLAVRLAPQTSSRPASPASEEEETETEDDSDIDGFLSSHGFEYIDASKKDIAQGAEEEDSESEDWSSEIPGIERVLDALSTIMWSSMQPRSKDTKQSPYTRERERALLDWANTSQDNSLPAVEEIVTNSRDQLSETTKSMKREMEELARWLEEDITLRDDPWKSAISSGAMSSSPTTMDFDDKLPEATVDTFGFEDDFTVFVSAPALEPTEISGRSTPDMDAPLDGLSPSSATPHAGSLYRSLGSMSDFGGSEDGKDVGDDEDLPSKEEIMATTSRIFGPTKLPLPPAIEARTNTVKASKTSERRFSVTEVPDDLPNEGLDAFAAEDSAADGDESYDMEPFDLSKVLGALQEMKAEISGMEDEGERRKAAARVALGLVYGLEADAEL